MDDPKKDYKGMLPIGSVVRIEDVEQYIVICGRIVCPADEERLYDYVGFPYPEGMGREDLLFFDREAIADLLFIGFQDELELRYRSEILDKLGELAVEDGEIVLVGGEE